MLRGELGALLDLGVVSTARTASHVYNSAGTYTISGLGAGTYASVDTGVSRSLRRAFLRGGELPSFGEMLRRYCDVQADTLMGFFASAELEVTRDRPHTNAVAKTRRIVILKACTFIPYHRRPMPLRAGQLTTSARPVSLERPETSVSQESG